MKVRGKSAALLAAAALAAVCTAGAPPAAPVRVEVRHAGGQWTLLRGGKPYFVRGAGGTEQLDLARKSGANSLRTWGTDNLAPLLDRAQSLDLTVAAGIWLGHEEHGFRYDDPKAVAAQLAKARADVERYRSHPALLVWGAGNEMEGGKGDTPRIWQAVEEVARMIHTVDPNHPVMTVVAEIGGEKIPNLKRYCPDVDILGVNSYGGLASLPQRLKEKGWDRPYMATEFGPLGQWEVGKTSWGAPLEQTSSEKARMYLANYQRSIAGQPGWCLGSYAFLWGWKQEVTHTWYGMLLPAAGGVERTAAADAMTDAWTGRRPPNRAPEIEPIRCEAAGKTVSPGASLTASVSAKDPESDPLRVEWQVRSESGGGEGAPPAHPECIVRAQGMSLEFRAPTRAGAYRLFATVHDGRGGAATANACFQAKGGS